MCCRNDETLCRPESIYKICHYADEQTKRWNRQQLRVTIRQTHLSINHGVLEYQYQVNQREKLVFKNRKVCATCLFCTLKYWLPEIWVDLAHRSYSLVWIRVNKAFGKWWRCSSGIEYWVKILLIYIYTVSGEQQSSGYKGFVRGHLFLKAQVKFTNSAQKKLTHL